MEPSLWLCQTKESSQLHNSARKHYFHSSQAEAITEPSLWPYLTSEFAMWPCLNVKPSQWYCLIREPNQLLHLILEPSLPFHSVTESSQCHFPTRKPKWQPHLTQDQPPAPPDCGVQPLTRLMAKPVAICECRAQTAHLPNAGNSLMVTLDLKAQVAAPLIRSR